MSGPQAHALFEEVLRPAAASVDLDGKIPQSHFEALRSRGFYGLAFATDSPVTALSDVGEILVSGCLSTAFVWAQPRHVGTTLPARPRTDGTLLRPGRPADPEDHPPIPRDDLARALR